jgi:hypothetical protein
MSEYSTEQLPEIDVGIGNFATRNARYRAFVCNLFDLKFVSVGGNGNCFFESLSLLLRPTWPSLNATELRGFDGCAAATRPGLNVFAFQANGMYDIFATMPISCFEGVHGHAISANETPHMFCPHCTTTQLVTKFTTCFQGSSRFRESLIGFVVRRILNDDIWNGRSRPRTRRTRPPKLPLIIMEFII